MTNEKQFHNCPDGTIYDWISRVPKPKQCPRCKSMIGKAKPKPVVVKVLKKASE